MNYFRINTLAKSLKQNYEGFMLSMAFIVMSFLNILGSDKTDTSVPFLIFYYWKLNCKWEKKAFLFLLMREDVWQSNLEYQFVAKSIFVKSFCQFLIFRIVWNHLFHDLVKRFLLVSLSLFYICSCTNVCGWSVRYKTLLMVFKLVRGWRVWPKHEYWVELFYRNS